MKITKILIIDKDPGFRTLLKMFLLKIAPAAQVDQVDPLASGRPGKNLEWAQYDLLFMEYDPGQGENGLDWLCEYNKNESFPATIILDAHGDEESAARSIRSGAHDYISKEKISNNRLLEAINRAPEPGTGRSTMVNTQSLRTTLFNKVYFHNRLRTITAGKNTGNSSFILQVMIDEFQELHEKLGLFGADHLVSEVAEGICNILDNDQYQLNVIRIGDSTIGCLVSGDPDNNHGKNPAEILCERLPAIPFFHNNEKVSFSVSIGVTRITETTPVEQLLQQADQACFSAGGKQGNSYFVYANTGPAGSVETPDKTGKQTDSFFNLQEAIDNNRLQPCFQHLTALSESATMFDADFAHLKVRLIEQDGTTSAPEDIKNARLQEGDRGLLDRWLIRYGLGKLLSSGSSGNRQKHGLIIPLSRESLLTSDFSGWLAKLILKTRISNITSTIVFEIGPTDFLSSKDNTLSIMHLMRDKWGISFALTDVANVSELNTCLQRGGFEFVKFSLDKDKISTMREIAISCKEFGSLTILENILDGEGRAYAAHAGIDFLMGDFIQAPQDDLL